MNQHYVCTERLVQDPKFVRWDSEYEPVEQTFGNQFIHTRDAANAKYEITRYEINYTDGSTFYPIYIRAKWLNDPAVMRPYRVFGYNDYHEPLHLGDDEIYYNVEYQVLNADGSIYNDKYWPANKRYWTYYAKSGRYPELNLEDDGGDQPVQTYYFPIVPMRINNVDMVRPEVHDTPLYKTSKKLLNYIHVDIDELGNAISESPDIDKLDHAYVVFGIDVHTDSQAGTRYLFEYFEDEYSRQERGETEFLGWRNSSSFSYFLPPLNMIRITDGTYDVELGFCYITLSQEKGKIGKVNFCDKVINTPSPKIKRHSIPSGAVMWWSDNSNTLTLRKQIDEDTVRTVTVHGLVHSNQIYKTDKFFYTTLAGSENQDQAPIVIPLNVAIAHALSVKDSNVLYYESLHCVFNAYEVIELEWYQTGLFQFFTLVISIPLTIFAGGLDNLVQSLISASVAGLTSTAIAISNIIIQSIITSFAFKFAVETLGIEWAAVLTAVIIATGYLGDQMGWFEIPDITQFFETMVSSFGTAVKQDLHETALDIQAQTESMREENEKLMEEIIEAQKQLSENQIILDPLELFTDIGVFPWESGSDWVDRMLKVDYSTDSINAVSKFVDSTLLLPTDM